MTTPPDDPYDPDADDDVLWEVTEADDPPAPAPQAIPRLFGRDSMPIAIPVESDESQAPAGGRGMFSWSEPFCWFILLGMTALLFSSTVGSQLFPDPTEVPASQMSGHLLTSQLNGKMLTFAARFIDAQWARDNLPSELIDQGSILERYAIVVMIAELESPRSAWDAFQQIDVNVKRDRYAMTDMESRVQTILHDIMERRRRIPAFDSSVINEADREYLIEQMGWLGKLALTPASSPNLSQRAEVERSAWITGVAFIAFGAMFLLALLGGVVLLVTFFVMLVTGRVRSHTPDWSGSRAIYLETFTIWLAMFMGSQILLQIAGFPQSQMLAIAPVLFFASLGVLAWPVLRGIPLRHVLGDTGLLSPRKFADSLWGVPLYVSLLPVIVVCAVVNLIGASLIIALFAEPGHSYDALSGVAHPLQEELTGPGIGLFMVVLAACVAAPIVEEIFFRGVFHRYLRDRFSALPRWLGILIAAGIGGVIFAAVHPQGILGILMLTGLACGLTLAREWRGSLYPAIIMHGINNSAVTALMLIVFQT